VVKLEPGETDAQSLQNSGRTSTKGGPGVIRRLYRLCKDRRVLMFIGCCFRVLYQELHW